MSRIQSKLLDMQRQRKIWPIVKKIKAIEIKPNMVEMFNWSDKCAKVAIIKIFKELKEDMFRELKESMTLMSEEIRSWSRYSESIKTWNF